MVKTTFIALICCFLGSSVWARSEKDVTAKARALQAKGIKLIVEYYPHCVGADHVQIEPGPCDPQEIRYLFWQDAQHNYVQRFDDCNKYEPLIDKVDKIIELMSLKKMTLLKEVIKAPEFKIRYNGKVETIMTLRDHSCHASFSFYGSKIITKDIDHFFLTPTIDDNDYNNGKVLKRKNINYLHNSQTYLVRLKNLAEQKIAELYPSAR